MARLLPTTVAIALAVALTGCATDGAGAPATTVAVPPAADPNPLPSTSLPSSTTTSVPLARALGTVVVDAPVEPAPESPPGDGGDAPVPTERSLADLQVGDCVDLDGLDQAGSHAVSRVTLLDCASPHDAEVYALISLDDDPVSRHPGDEHVLAAADRVCLDAFGDYVGVRYVDTRLEIVHLRPTVASWARGDRRVMCAVVNASGAPLVGSVAGAGDGAVS